MKECGWEEDRVGAHLQFWMNLSAHEWRHDPEDAACQALIVYQAMYRRRWHDTLGTASSFNLKYLDEEALIKIKFKITSKIHTAITNQAREVSTIFNTPSCTHFSPQITHYTFRPHQIFFSYFYSIGLHAQQQWPLVRTHYTAHWHVAPQP
ncbi:hypothetical protein BDN67DRAFT_682819 [Paxillus ammoniavirescens]|nr:hypothetical protein BDN67DRAFT_682819 [Paxillus ammoniavirescens]